MGRVVRLFVVRSFVVRVVRAFVRSFAVRSFVHAASQSDLPFDSPIRVVQNECLRQECNSLIINKTEKVVQFLSTDLPTHVRFRPATLIASQQRRRLRTADTCQQHGSRVQINPLRCTASVILEPKHHTDSTCRS